MPIRLPSGVPAGNSDGATSSAPVSAASLGTLNSEEAQRRPAIAIRQSVAFAQIVSVLMRSPHHKHYTLTDPEWLVLPPLMTGQFRVAEASAQGNAAIPVAVALWASVSTEVDKRLSENLTAPMRLRPDEWRSGNIPWLVAAVGDGRVVPQFLKRLDGDVFKGQEVKMRGRGSDGKAVVQVLHKGE